MRTKDRVAIVTGGAGAVGGGISRCLAREGAHIVVADIALEAAEKRAEEIRGMGRRSLAVQADITLEKDCQGLVQASLKEFGCIDILVNNAGHFGHTLALPFTNLTGQDWDDNFAVNVKGPFFMCKAVAAHMMERRYGKIVNISSISAKRDPIFLPNYAAAKNAVLSLTRVVAKQLGPYNVNANAVCPGLVWTPFWERLAPMLVEQDPDRIGQDPRAVFDEVAGAAVLGRPQTPEDVGNLVAFLSSEEACNITGQAIHVDGGIAMG
jgi:NAD(P)-dependent dehydrogenase (short-subunit alcohol dehydrogenase family)